MDVAISIHAPHVGRDLGRMMQNMDDMQFQSTHPVRGATKYMLRDRDDLEIV